MSSDLVRLVRLGLGLYVRNLLQCLNYAAFCAELGALCWQPRSLLGELGAVCWQPTGPKSPVGPSLRHALYDGNLQVSWVLLDQAWSCMLATYRSHGACWTELGAATDKSYGTCWAEFGGVCWQRHVFWILLGPVGPNWKVWRQPTGSIGLVGPSLGLYACWKPPAGLVGLLDRAWGCMLATTEFGAVCRQHTGLMKSLGLLGGNLHVLSCWTEFEAICWQPTGLLGPVGLSLGCWQPRVRNLGACWTELGAVHWEPTGFVVWGCI